MDNILINDNCLKIYDDIIKDEYIIVSDPPFNIKYKYNKYKELIENLLE